MKKIVEKIKKKLRPYLRSEQTSLFWLFVCRSITELNCLVHQVRYFSLKSKTRSALKSLREKRAKNVFVFANGPSISELDLKKVKKLVDSKEFDLITVNSFASEVMDEYGLCPTVSIFADPSHYLVKGDAEYLEQSNQDVEAVNRHGVLAMVPYKLFKKSQFKHSIPYCGIRNVYRKNVTNFEKPFGYFYLTAFHALSLAINLEYENVYICGFDNSYFKSYGIDMDGRQYFEDTHFYDDKISKFYLPTSKYGPTPYIFYDTYRHFKFLEKISNHGKKNVSISNIAKVTYTDAFPRYFDLDVYKDV